MKKLKVCGFSAMMDSEMNIDSIEYASDIFEMMMNSDIYTHGYIADNETGEVYCYFNKEVDGNGIKTEYWTAFA